MKKLLSILGAVSLTAITANSVIACKSDILSFNFINLLKSDNIIKSSTSDNKGNIYLSTFDNKNISVLGEKIWKYNINKKENKIVWENKNFKTASFQLAVDNKENFYLGSSGGVTILNNKNKVQQMPIVEGKTNCIFVKENIVYVSTMKGLYKYNIENNTTEKINLLNNSVIYNIFFDSKNNGYFGIYKSDLAGGYILKNGKNNLEPILGENNFNKDTTYQINEINNEIYFNVINEQNEENKLYKISLLEENKANYLMTIPKYSYVFKINNKFGLIIREKRNIKIAILNNKSKNIKEIYKIDIVYFKNVIELNNEIYLVDDTNIYLVDKK